MSPIRPPCTSPVRPPVELATPLWTALACQLGTGVDLIRVRMSDVRVGLELRGSDLPAVDRPCCCWHDHRLVDGSHVDIDDGAAVADLSVHILARARDCGVTIALFFVHGVIVARFKFQGLVGAGRYGYLVTFGLLGRCEGRSAAVMHIQFPTRRIAGFRSSPVCWTCIRRCLDVVDAVTLTVTVVLALIAVVAVNIDVVAVDRICPVVILIGVVGVAEESRHFLVFCSGSCEVKGQGRSITRLKWSFTQATAKAQWCSGYVHAMCLMREREE